LFTKVSPEGREGRCVAFNSLLTALNEPRSSRGYSNWSSEDGYRDDLERRSFDFSYQLWESKTYFFLIHERFTELVKDLVVYMSEAGLTKQIYALLGVGSYASYHLTEHSELTVDNF
jgi:hypothetical protein